MRLKHLGILAKLLVTAALAWFLLRGAVAGDALDLLAAIRPWPFLLAVLLFVAAVALNAVRWRLVLARLGARVPLGVSAVGTFEGMFFNLFLPTGFGGDVVRAYRAYDHGLTPATAATGALIDRAFGLWGLAAALLAAAPFAARLWAVPLALPLIGLAAAIVAGGLAVAWMAPLLPPPSGVGILSSFLRLVQDYSAIVRSGSFWSAIVPILALSNLAACLSALAAAWSLGIAVTFAESAIVVEAGSLVALVPVSIGGWGVREGTVAYLVHAMGGTSAEGVALSVALGAVITIIGLVGAAFWIASPYKRSLGLASSAAETGGPRKPS